jgi:hypothetical protein
MARIKVLTALKIKQNLKPGMYADGLGLYLKVRPGNSKSWSFRYRTGGRLRDMGLGPFHTVSLAEAREKAEVCRATRIKGLDPLEERLKEQQAKATEAAEAITFEKCAETRMVKKLRLLKGGSVPTFFVLGPCCTTSLPWTLEQVRRGSQAILGYRRLVQQFQCSVAVLELLTRATEAWVVAAGNEHLVNRSSRIVDGVSRRCTAGKPVRMDVAGGWRYQFHERPMSRIGILVSLD